MINVYTVNLMSSWRYYEQQLEALSHPTQRPF